MAGIKELRQRIKSVGNIKQITRAMEMVATTKLRRFQDRAIASRPYADEITGLVGRLSAVLGDRLADRPLFQQGKGDRSLVLVVSSDRGLCGAYNSNLFRVLENWVIERADEAKAKGEELVPADYYVYGNKAYNYMRTRGFQIEQFLTEPRLEDTDFHNAAVTARMLANAFESGKYRDVRILSTRFETMSKYVPEFVQFLPVEAQGLAGGDGDKDDAADEQKSSEGSDVILEPDAETIFDQLLPRYLETRIYNALLESLTSEYASRRFAMKNATDAATDMQGELKGIYNRKRQESITNELLDIVGGAEALR